MSDTEDLISYPIFLLCCQYTVDKFWENIFKNLARGKTPYGVYFNRLILCCKGKSGLVNCIIDVKDAKLLHDEIYKVFVDEMDILSHNERVIKRKLFVEFSNSESVVYWNDIKKKITKELLIDMFSLRIKKECFFTLKQTRYLRSFIQTALALKTILPTDIILDGSGISHIIGITFSKKKMHLDIDIYQLDIEHKQSISINIKKKMIDHWSRYILDISNMFG